MIRNNIELRPTVAICLLSLLFLFFMCLPIYADQNIQSKKSSASPYKWAFLTGYGTSYPGMGLTKERVETIDFVPRYQLVVLDDLGDGSWYQGYHSLLMELPLHLVFNPGTSVMASMNFLACYTFTTLADVNPYFFAGGGPFYSNSDIPGMGAHWNGNYQFGGGLQLKQANGYDLFLEYRFHHVSNGGRKEPNDPLNSSKFLLGFTF